MLLSFGYGDTARVGTVAYAAALVASLHIATGASRSRSARERTLLAIGATGWQMIRWLRIYEALPHCLSAIRQAVSLGLVVAVVTEMVVGAPHGLGTRAVSAQIAYDVPGLYGVILLTGAVGYVVAKLLFAVERRTLFWRD